MQTETSVMISTWNLDSTRSQRLYSGKKLVHSQNLILEINTKIQALEKEKNLQVPRD